MLKPPFFPTRTPTDWLSHQHSFCNFTSFYCLYSFKQWEEGCQTATNYTHSTKVKKKGGNYQFGLLDGTCSRKLKRDSTWKKKLATHCKVKLLFIHGYIEYRGFDPRKNHTDQFELKLIEN